MGAGIPGTGMATLFYIISVFLMPLREIVPTLRGQSSWARWSDSGHGRLPRDGHVAARWRT